MLKLIREMDIGRVSVLLFGLFPIIPNNLKGIPVILLVISSIVFLFKNPKQFYENIHPLRKRNWLLILPLTFLLFVVFGSKFSFDVLVLSKIETLLSLGIVPVFILANPKYISWNSKLIFVKTFTFSVLGLILFFLFHGIFYTNERYEGGLLNVDFVRDSVNNIPFIGTHPIYMSLMLGLAIIVITSKFSAFSKHLRIIYLIVFVGALLLISSKMVLVSIFVLSFIGLFKHVKISKRVIIQVFFYGMIVLILGGVYINSNHRLLEIFKANTYLEVHPSNSTSIRVGIYDCVIQKIKQAPVIGYGVENAQEALNLCYSIKSDILLDGNYNSHNQYLGFWLYGGIFLLIMSLLMIMIPLLESVKSNNNILLLIIVFFGVNLLTENILERRTGVILFAFFVSFFSEIENN